MVEQGTENPRVGGSIPSLATILLFVLSSACSSDECYNLCGTTATAVGACIDEWGVDWTYLGAERQSDFGDQCRDQWQEEKATLEPRQVEEAESECAAAATSLQSVTCEELRALYL